MKKLLAIAVLGLGLTGCAHMGKTDLTNISNLNKQARSVIKQGCESANEVDGYLALIDVAIQNEIGKKEEGK